MMDGIGTEGSIGIGKDSGTNERIGVVVGNPSQPVSKYVEGNCVASCVCVYIHIYDFTWPCRKM
jgi:hypothetical protein